MIGGSDARYTAFMLHGILGSQRNWRSFARNLTAAHPHWRFVLVDLRNHGDSHPAPPPHTLDRCAADVAVLAQSYPPETVFGHSYGGKVALTYAQRHGVTVQSVWALDSPPGGSREDASAHTIERLLSALYEIPVPLPDRETLTATLDRNGLDALAGWMSTNLRRGAAGGYVWRVDLEAIGEMLDDYWRQDLWPFVLNPPPGLDVHLVRAVNSDRWSPAEIARSENLGLGGHLHLLEDAGHWLHVDNPHGLARLLARTLDAP